MSTAVPTMGSESGYAVEEQPAPIRLTGFLSALLGLASGFCLLGRPLLFLPVLAILFGLIALRKCDVGTPIGTLAAKFGLFFAVAFGSAGLVYPLSSQRLVGAEAEQFANDYLYVIARGDFQMAMELGKPWKERLPAKMSLIDHYAPLREAATPTAEHPNSVALYDQRDGVLELVEMGADIEIFRSRRTRMYSRFGEPRIDTYWNCSPESLRTDLIVTLSYEPNPVDSSKREWFVKDLKYDEEQPVAERNF